MQCTQSELYNGVQISGGSKAGDFTDVGNVGRMHICTRLCCEEPTCDLAYMVHKSCFLVKCADEKRCRVVFPTKTEKHSNKTGDTSVQYIVKRKYDVQFGKGRILLKRVSCFQKCSYSRCAIFSSLSFVNVVLYTFKKLKM